MRKVWKELPFLRAVNGGRECIVEVEPLISGSRFAEESVILERFLRVGSKAVYKVSANFDE